MFEDIFDENLMDLDGEGNSIEEDQGWDTGNFWDTGEVPKEVWRPD